MTIDEVVDMLNEATTLSPSLWSLFDVQVPCASIVGHVTPIELMSSGPKSIALANVLGLLNGVLGDPGNRISIIVENKGGRQEKRFIRTAVQRDDASTVESGVPPVA